MRYERAVPLTGDPANTSALSHERPSLQDQIGSSVTDERSNVGLVAEFGRDWAMSRRSRMSRQRPFIAAQVVQTNAWS